MTFEQMQYVVAVYKYGTISQAAQMLNISHPSISRAITNLELELGIHIFVRSRSGTRPTIEGEQVIHLAKEILDKHDEMLKINRDFVLRGVVNILTYPMSSLLSLTPALQQFQDSFPELTINVSERDLSFIVDSVRNKQVGIAFVLLTPYVRSLLGTEFEYVTLQERDFCVLCDKDHEIADRECISLEECLQYPLVTNSDPLIIENIIWMLKNVGTPKFTFYSNDESLRKAIIKGSKNIAFFYPEREAIAALSSNFRVIPIIENHARLKAEYVCIYNKGRRFSFLERKLLSLIRGEAKKAGAEECDDLCDDPLL